jgi:mono/diheme cytochrome c family protein
MRRKTRWPGCAAVLLAGMACVAPGAARAQQEEPAAPALPPGVDYWQPDWMVRELWGPGRMPQGMVVRLQRHTTYMQHGVPPAYRGARSDLAPSREAMEQGGRTYLRECAACHGKDGLGDGDAENALSPSPALLAYMIRQPVAVDEYLLWSIADGGAEFKSQMPAYNDKLARNEIWRVIAYMRAGFPPLGPDGTVLPPRKTKPVKPE